MSDEKKTLDQVRDDMQTLLEGMKDTHARFIHENAQYKRPLSYLWGDECWEDLCDLYNPEYVEVIEAPDSDYHVYSGDKTLLHGVYLTAKKNDGWLDMFHEVFEDYIRVIDRPEQTEEVETPFQRAIREECAALAEFLIAKNKAYGDSAAKPVRVFARGVSPKDQIFVRMDDKLSRLARGHEFDGDDTMLDLAGYIVLYRAIERTGGFGE